VIRTLCGRTHPASCTMGTGSFPGVKSGQGVTLTPSPPSSAVVKKEYSYISTPPMGHTACTEPQCLYNGALYLSLTCSRTTITRYTVRYSHKPVPSISHPQIYFPVVYHSCSFPYYLVSASLFLKQFPSKILFLFPPSVITSMPLF